MFLYKWGAVSLSNQESSEIFKNIMVIHPVIYVVDCLIRNEKKFHVYKKKLSKDGLMGSKFTLSR